MRKFASITSFILIIALVVNLGFSSMSVSAASSSITPREYNGSLEDFRSYCSSAAINFEIVVWVIGFVTMITVTSRNVDLDLNLSSTSSLQDKLTAYGNYALNNLWNSVKDLAIGVVDWQVDNHINSWSDLARLEFSNLLMSVTKISFAIGDLVYTSNNPILDIAGTTGNYPTVPVVSYSDTLSVYLSSNLTSYSPLGYVSKSYRNNRYYWYAYSSFLDSNSLTDLYIIYSSFYIGSTLYYCFRPAVLENGAFRFVSVPYNFITSLFSVGNDSETPSIGTFTSSSFSSSSVSYTTNTFNYVFNNVDIGFYSTFSKIVNYFMSLGAISILSYTGTGYLSNLNSISSSLVLPLYGDITALVNTNSNYITFPSADLITVDLTTLPDRLTDISSSTDVSDKITAIVGDYPQTIVSAVDSTINFPSAPSYNFPSLTDVWKYPTYLFNLVRPFFLFCKDCLDSVTLSSGGLSWVFFGGFLMLVCGGVINKFLS